MQITLHKPKEISIVDKDKLVMKPISYQLAKQIIEENHYSHTIPMTKICLGFFIDDWITGAIVYGHGVTNDLYASIADGLDETNCLELTRLFSFDWCGKNFESCMIGKSIRYIKQNYPDIKCLVSFADETYGHIGTIYQATNWIYTGTTNGGNIYLDDKGNKIHPRTIGHKRLLYDRVPYGEEEDDYEKVVVGDIDTKEMCNFLNVIRKQKNIPIKEFDKIFGYKDTAGHWFRTDKGRTLPNVDDWFKLKEILGFADTYDKVMMNYKYRIKLNVQLKRLKLSKLKTDVKHRYIFPIADINLKLKKRKYPKLEYNTKNGE